MDLHNFSPVLANAVLMLHLGYVVFVASGFVIIPVGAMRHWRWTQTLRYRGFHTVAIGYVALEQLLHVPCPLTVWEYRLRGDQGPAHAFLPRLIHDILFYRWPSAVFTGLYVGLTIFVLVFWWVFPPDRSGR